MRHFPCALLAVVLGVAISPARGAEEVQRVLLLPESRPVLLGFHVQLDGKPLAAGWQRYLDRLFNNLDRDGDGILNRAEAARAPSVEFLNSFLQGGLPLESATNTIPFESLDTNRDGRVSRQEFAAYYQGCPLDRMQVVAGPDRDQAAALTNILFALLDKNRDGQLSKEELTRAGEVLRRIDLDQDEWITPEELLLHRPPQAEQAKGRATLESIGFLPLPGEPLPPERSRLVLDRYGMNARALTGLLSKPPEVELIARLGAVAPGEATSDLLRPTQGKTLRTREGGLQVAIEKMALELAVEKSGGGRVRGLHAFYRQQFEAADADRRTFLERQQVEEVASLAALFLLADRDQDGRLTTSEFDAFLDLHALGAESFVTLTVTDQSLSLFDLLDEDGNGRLSLRELHTAWDRLRRFDRDGDGRLARTEFPRRLQLRASRGTPPSRPASAVRTAADLPRPQGPAWFRKMDRNGDGFVSRREFLGPEEVFKQLDVDGDGLISPEEASRK